MATKMYRARLVGLPPRMEAAVERTHYVFVECLSQMIERYLQMRKGKYGEDCRQLVLHMLSRSNTFAHGVMDKLSRPTWEATLSADWVHLAAKILKEKGPLFEQHTGFAVVDGVTIHTKPHGKLEPTRNRLAVTAKFWHQVCDSASAHLKTFDELMKIWRAEREQWLQKKIDWEAVHPEFIAFWEGPYSKFEQACESARITAQLAARQETTQKKKQSRERGKRVERWHLWYEWIVAHPEIIEWQGKAKATDFKEIPPDVAAKIKEKHPRQDKHIPKFLNWLDDNNPELKALNSLRRQYARRFLRFKRPPTLTLPSASKHPYWFTFERDVFYKDVDFENGTIQLLLIDEQAEGTWALEWMPARFQCDPRLKPPKRANIFATEGRHPPYIEGKVGRSLNRPAEKAEDRKAGYAGAKLVIRKNRKELLFTVVEQDCPHRVNWKKVKNRLCPADNAFLPDGERGALKVMAIDLGIRHAGAYVIAEGHPTENGWGLSYAAKGMIRDGDIPNLHRIRGHDRALRAGRRERGKAVRGERSFVELQDHRTGMADDRFKKVASTLVETARKQNVDLVLFERLDSLSPSAFDERWMNRQLRDMNRRRIVEMAKEQCKEFGIECKDDINPWLTSHICSQCYRPGWRFSIKKKEPYKESCCRSLCKDYGYPIWDRGGHLFRCPHCGYSVNADINAAGNVVSKFFGQWSLSELSRKDWVYTWQEGGGEKTFAVREVFEEWVQDVKRRKLLDNTPF